MRRTLPLLALAAVAGCHDHAFDPPVTHHRQGLAARCTATVRGVGEVDIETVYLPAVIACENGAAADEALKAQAVAARTYLYFKLETSGSIADGTSDQVYSCPRPPQARHIAAVEATQGEVLMHDDIVLAAFYVAGAIPNPPECVPQPGDRDPTGTEQWVTYNAGRRGGDVQPSPLGHPANPRNRGCKSQNGAHCLATAGQGYRDILRFYYGADVQVVRAEGACVDAPPPPDPDAGPPPEPDAGPPPGECEAVLGAQGGQVDDGDACFDRACESGDWWDPHPVGEGGACVTTGTIDRDRPDCVGRWHLALEAAGEYAVDVHLPDPGVPLTRQARYVIRHAGREDEVRLDQAARGGWVSLGRFDFRAGGDQWVALLDNTGEPYRDGGERLVYDAVRLRPAAAAPVDAGPPVDDMGAEAPDQGGDPDQGLARPDRGPRPDAGAPPEAGAPPTRPDAGGVQFDAGPSAVARQSLQTGGCQGAPGPAPWWAVLALLSAARRPRRRPGRR